MTRQRTYWPRDEPEVTAGDAAFLGVNVRLAPDKLPPGFLADSENNRMSDGDVVPRLGCTKPGWLNATDAAAGPQIRPVDAFYGGGVFQDPDSVEWTLQAADGGIFRCRPHNARFAMPLPTGVQVLSRCTFTQAFNKVFCFRGRYLAPLVLRAIDTGWEDMIQRWSSSATYDAAITDLQQLAEEIAYGPFVTIATEITLNAGQLTSSGGTATVTHADHGYLTADVITISGAVQTEYNGTYPITRVSSSVFTYPFAGSATSPATGTIKMVKSGVTSSADLVTVVTPTAHGYVTGADITITGATQTEYNGRWNITVLDDVTFTYNFTGSTSAVATGTIAHSDMSNYWAALGSRVTLTSITRVSQVATATKNSHSFSNGQYVTVSGAAQTEYNGTFVISNVTANTFDYTVTGSPATTATGTILARTSLVLAGQSPDTNPEAWARRYDVIPNADDALFINNRLLIPTAYTPGADGYDSTSTWTKKDFIVATDVLDELHFDFINEFRINQGDDSEIVQLLKYDNNTVLVFKGKVWGIISNIRVDLAQVTLDMRSVGYGLCARGAAVVAGKQVYFVASNRGVVSLNQTEQGLLQSVDVPFSNDIEPWIRRINWNLKDQIRLAWWDNKLFVGAPMDDCVVHRYLAPNTDTYQAITPDSGFTNFSNLTPGAAYVWTHGNESQLEFSGLDPGASGMFTAFTDFVTADGSPGLTVTGRLDQPLTNVANAILVHDFRNQAWAGRDTGSAICPQEFLTATFGGKERLFMLGYDGFCSMLEESRAGDQVQDRTAANELGWLDISTRVQTRGYRHDELAPKKFPTVELALSVWAARFTVNATTGQSRYQKVLALLKTFSRTRYLKPFDRTHYVATNVNNDHAEPNRGDYSVRLDADGFYCGTAGIDPEQNADVFIRYGTRTLNGPYVTFLLTNDRGRCVLKSVAPTAQPGQRRLGVLI